MDYLQVRNSHAVFPTRVGMILRPIRFVATSFCISHTRALYVASAVRTEVITAEDSLSVTKETTYKDALALKTKEIRAKDSRDSIDGDKPPKGKKQCLVSAYFPHAWG